MQDLRPHLEKIFSPLSGDEEEAEEGEDGEGKPMTATELRRRARQGEP
jgi:hypothetical protein